MNNLSSNSSQAGLGKEICQLSQYETFPFLDAESVNTHLIVFAIIIVAMALMAVCGNALILAAIWKTSSLRSPSYLLISVLVLSDLGVGLILQPTFAIGLSTRRRINCNAFKILSATILLFMAVSFFTITATSVERLLALRFHLRYQELNTNKRILLVVALFCVAESVCQIMRFLVEPMILGSMIIFVTSVGMIVNIYSYWKIFQIVKIYQAQIHAQVQFCQSSSSSGMFPNMARYKKSVLTMLYIYGFFVLCFFPFSVVGIAAYMMPNDSIYLFNNISLTISFSNSAMNPFLFCWRMSEIRLSVKNIIQKWKNSNINVLISQHSSQTNV